MDRMQPDKFPGQPMMGSASVNDEVALFHEGMTQHASPLLS